MGQLNLDFIVESETTSKLETPVVEKWIEEWARYPSGKRFFIKKYPIGETKRQFKKKPRSQRQLPVIEDLEDETI